jgi:Fur family ferric uptake transcriptional regulator
MSIRIKTHPVEEGILRRYCAENGLHMSKRRLEVLRVFLSVEQHLSAEELFKLMHREGLPVAYATVYRTLRLLVSSGLARRVVLGGRSSRFEHAMGHQHHDHLVCTRCGTAAEFYHPRIEELQREIARAQGFRDRSHSLTIYGLCPRCARKEAPGAR